MLKYQFLWSTQTHHTHTHTHIQTNKQINTSIHAREAETCLRPHLLQVERDCDPVESSSVGDRRALPPSIAAVDRVLDRVPLAGLPVLVAHPALDPVERSPLDVLDQFAELLGAVAIDWAARRIADDVRLGRQVEHVRKESCREGRENGNGILTTLSHSTSCAIWAKCLRARTGIGHVMGVYNNSRTQPLRGLLMVWRRCVHWCEVGWGGVMWVEVSERWWFQRPSGNEA